MMPIARKPEFDPIARLERVFPFSTGSVQDLVREIAGRKVLNAYARLESDGQVWLKADVSRNGSPETAEVILRDD